MLGKLPTNWVMNGTRRRLVVSWESPFSGNLDYCRTDKVVWDKNGQR